MDFNFQKLQSLYQSKILIPLDYTISENISI